ncbi:menaquinone-dependent protoporphyrinogen IX dehydrogenase [Proteus sp. GOKU]|uniref:menaquinone-dependent protoporphyrinogen IX dehydrogenase n=1 Tax=Proteus TaxID=583 RepID=UPI001892CD0E|nr:MULTISPECIES: menaquinone-dependent protoporphyrinogen IX dehydrogenase [Proteus]QPB78263.1 menaquinone-dependent protoporphyrinogen IX dehydrogenase [Proteus sp. GOKU]QQP24270.1 menaquinone-dependent protoporphyrinogen IX dehydrogenase [Proteus vulgaris]
MSALLLYCSTDGQTKKIMTQIANELRQHGHDCDVRDLTSVQQSLNLSAYSKVLVGASIRYGYFNKVLDKFITRHLTQLNNMPSAFFGVNLTARKAEKNTPETNSYIRKFLEKTPWKPTLTGVFAGALYYPRYKWIDRVMIQLIMKMTKGETDPTKEIEYTDWNKVSEFATNFAKIE